MPEDVCLMNLSSNITLCEFLPGSWTTLGRHILNRSNTDEGDLIRYVVLDFFFSLGSYTDLRVVSVQTVLNKRKDKESKSSTSCVWRCPFPFSVTVHDTLTTQEITVSGRYNVGFPVNSHVLHPKMYRKLLGSEYR